MLDKVLVAPGSYPNSSFIKLLKSNLNLSKIAQVFPKEIAINLVTEQYDSSLEFIYSHPIWASFRTGRGSKSILSYLLETRQYLACAAARMSPGVSADPHDGTVAELLSRHLVEEANHAQFFDKALRSLGCSPEIVEALRLGPMTLEWVYLQRNFSSENQLTAAICSGLMEESARDQSAVKNWHGILISKGLLPRAAVESIFRHVEVDITLGHGDNWKRVIRELSPVPADWLRNALNACATVSEMIVRWLDFLETGLSSTVIDTLPELTCRSLPSTVDPMFNGLPVFSSEILHQFSYGARNPSGVKRAIALTYSLRNRHALQVKQGASAEFLQRFGERVSSKTNIPTSHVSLELLIQDWMRCIDGHRLWKEMTSKPEYALIFGWLLENYHYIALVSQHVSAGIAACPDSNIRTQLLDHLDDELNHGEILRHVLEDCEKDLNVESLRPLPTTLAFTGFLKELAGQDWKAYCVAIGFLQLSLSANHNDAKHVQFYKAISAHSPILKRLVGAMVKHDCADRHMKHHGQIRKLLGLLASRHRLSSENVSRASLVAQLSWSFLDGIRNHYCHGRASLIQRIGWS